MPIKRMNHAVLYVRDADRTFEFYRDLLGFRVVGEFPGAKFLQAPDSTNDHDLALFSIGEDAGPSTAGRSTVGLYHIAWEVQTLGDLQGPVREGSRRAGVRGVLDRAQGAPHRGRRVGEARAPRSRSGDRALRAGDGGRPLSLSALPPTGGRDAERPPFGGRSTFVARSGYAGQGFEERICRKSLNLVVTAGFPLESVVG